MKISIASKQLFALVGVAVMATSASLAAPSVSSTSGTFSHGNSVTISGSSFGSKSTAAPVKYDDFDGGVAGNER